MHSSSLAIDSSFKMGHCYFDLPFEAAKLSTLFRPYDKFIWTGIILLLLVYSAVYTNPLIGLALFGFLLNQYVSKKLVNKLGWALLLSTVLTNAYLSIVTTDLVTPLRPRLYDTYGELYNNTDFR